MCTRRALFILFSVIFSLAAHAQNACGNRGELDEPFCDNNRDLLADAPLKLRNPTRLVMGFAAVEDQLSTTITYTPLVDHLKKCTKKDVVLYHSIGEPQVLEGLRTGEIHIGQFATGATMYAVNFAGAVPFAGKGTARFGGPDNYTLMVIVRADSPYKKLTDLKGKQIAHTKLSSNSGNFAPRALLPDEGLVPELDYQVVYSGSHDNSITGVANGLYPAAAVASDVLERMISKGEVKRNQIKVLFQSESFPPDAFSLAYDLDNKLANDIKKCFYEFHFPAGMSRRLENNDRFYPLNYSQDWKLVRLISKASGNKMTRQAYDNLVKKKPS